MNLRGDTIQPIIPNTYLPLPIAPILFDFLNEVKVGKHRDTSSSEEIAWASGTGADKLGM